MRAWSPWSYWSQYNTAVLEVKQQKWDEAEKQEVEDLHRAREARDGAWLASFFRDRQISSSAGSAGLTRPSRCPRWATASCSALLGWFFLSLMAITDDWGKTWHTSTPLIAGGNIQPSIAHAARMVRSTIQAKGRFATRLITISRRRICPRTWMAILCQVHQARAFQRSVGEAGRSGKDLRYSERPISIATLVAGRAGNGIDRVTGGQVNFEGRALAAG